MTGPAEKPSVHDNPIHHKGPDGWHSAGDGDGHARVALYLECLLQTLLSEHCLRCETVEKIDGKMTPREIEKDGPTGVIVATTKSMLHPENETRLPSLRVHDFAEHIKAVMRSVATRSREEADYSEWRALQTWIAGQDNRVVVPYALPLVDLIPPVDIRINRDVESLLNAIQAHAILHQATHERNADGEIVATLDYFDAVHGLVGGVVSAAVATRVPPQLRTIVSALKMLLDDDTKSTQFALRDKTGFSRSQVGHWLRARAT